MFLSEKTYSKLTNSIIETASDEILAQINESILFPLRRFYLTRLLSSYFDSGQQVLDLGASDGRLAAAIQRRLQKSDIAVMFQGCDICLQPETHIPICHYDGKKIPFADNSFDVVMIVDVLHHANEPHNLIREAQRVARHFIVVKDHYWQSQKDLISLRFADYIGNYPYDINLPYRFWTLSEWEKVFLENNMNVVDSHQFKFNTLDICKHVLFKIKV